MTAPVSVIVPVRDGAAYLSATLDSILGQSLEPDEVVVVDDGSIDSTPEVLSRYGAPVRVERQGRLGLGTALNQGLATATAPLLGFCDADDLWTPTRLEHQVAHLERHPDCAGVAGGVQQFVTPERPELGDQVRVDGQPHTGGILGSLLIRRPAADRVGRFHESVDTGTCVEWVGRARHLGLRLDVLEEVMLLRRIHGANLSLRSGERTRAGLLWAARSQRRRHRSDAPK